MPIMKKNSIQGYASNYSQHFITEDPRPGHNVMYFGDGLNAYDSVSLKPLWGLAGTFRTATGNSYYGGPSYFVFNTNQENSKNTWMALSGAHPMAYGRPAATTTVNDGSYINNVNASMFGNMDSEQKPSQHYIKDNGDGTHDIIMHTAQQAWGHSQEYYTTQFHYSAIPDDLELYEVAPTYMYTTTTTTQYRGTGGAYSALDGTNSGFVQLNNLTTSRPAYPSFTMHRMGTTPIVEANGFTAGASNGYYGQIAGTSRLDGMPIFFEMWHSLYKPYFRAAKWNGTAWTALLSNFYTSNTQPRWPSPSTSFAYGSTTDLTDHNSGTGDAQATLASCWFRHHSQPANMYYTVLPLSCGKIGVPYADILRWDRGSDTFAGAGYQGVSTTYAAAYHRTGASNGWNSFFGGYVDTPYEARRQQSLQTATSYAYGTTQQALAYAFAADAHGFADADGSTETPFETERYPGGGDVLPITFMNMTAIDGAFDARAQGRALFCTTVYSTGAAYNGQHQARSVTWVPETVFDWCWCDSGKTTIAAICKNATYIYQCRKGASVTNGGSASSTYVNYPGNATAAYDTNNFNMTVNASSIAWVHTATIPYSVFQMGIDKHDRLWYMTYQSPGSYYQQTGANDRAYHRQMWMLTTATPHKVNLAGNATTDTISYSGSNIDKTLTVEALNFKGQKLAKTITLNITSSNAQFDNGSQTKDVTTSASGTVSETITVTGAGSFNITAAYGA